MKIIEKYDPEQLSKVDSSVRLSRDIEEIVIDKIISGELPITKDNVRLLNSFFSEDIVRILRANIDYLSLLNKENFTQTGIVRDIEFIELLKEKEIIVDESSSFLVLLCGDYVAAQYIQKKVSIDTITPFFPDYDSETKGKIINEYLKLGNTNFSIFTERDDNGELVHYMDDLSYDKNKKRLSTSKSESLLIYMTLPSPDLDIEEIYLSDNNIPDARLIRIFEYANENGITLYIKNGFKIDSTLENDKRFLELSGNVGNVGLSPFNIEEFNELLEEVKKHQGVVVNVSLEDFMNNEEYFLNLNTEVPINIKSQRDVSIIPLKEMVEIDKKMDEMVSHIKNSNLSPFEKYIAVYNIVKTFKAYNFYCQNESIDMSVPDQSRNPYLVMINSFIVCGGYSLLLQKLLQKVDIHSHYWLLNVSNESASAAERESDILETHARLYVNIVDEKYDIDGYYTCDPTWDNTHESMNIQGYKHLCMSVGESHDYGTDSSSYYFFSYDSESFNDEMFFNTEEYLKKDGSLEELQVIFKDLDPEFYEQLSTIEDIEKKKELIKQHISTKVYRRIYQDKKYNAIINILEFQKNCTYSAQERKDLFQKLETEDYGALTAESLADMSDEWVDDIIPENETSK